jgi:hypothetical protein
MEDAIGLESAWPDRLPTSAPVYPAATRRRWGRWIVALAAFAVLGYLGWRLGLAWWPELTSGFNFRLSA